MAVNTPNTYVPEFMKDWPEWRRKAALVGAVATAVAVGIGANIVSGLLDKPSKSPTPALTNPHHPRTPETHPQ